MQAQISNRQVQAQKCDPFPRQQIKENCKIRPKERTLVKPIRTTICGRTQRCTVSLIYLARWINERRASTVAATPKAQMVSEISRNIKMECLLKSMVIRTFKALLTN